jgi:hypothetical protein
MENGKQKCCSLSSYISYSQSNRVTIINFSQVKEGKTESERNEERKNEERRNDRYKENAVERTEKKGK